MDTQIVMAPENMWSMQSNKGEGRKVTFAFLMDFICQALAWGHILVNPP
jgi:hypothetical protein